MPASARRVRGDPLDLEPDNFDAVMKVNLRGTLFLTQKAVRRMLAAADPADHRAVILISSVSAELATPDRADYCISKAALAMWTKTLALRLAETSIGVYEIRPGIIRTEMTAQVAGRYDKLIAEGRVPARRWGERADVASVAVALAGGAFGFASGTRRQCRRRPGDPAAVMQMTDRAGTADYIIIGGGSGRLRAGQSPERRP